MAGLIAALIAARSLNALALGPDLAAAQGVSLVRTRLLVLGAVTLLAGGASAIAGPISFVGLVVPHLVRWGVGTDQRRILAGSLLAGGVLVLLADVLGSDRRPAERDAGRHRHRVRGRAGADRAGPTPTGDRAVNRPVRRTAGGRRLVLGTDHRHVAIGVREAVVCATAALLVSALAVVGLWLGDFPLRFDEVLGVLGGRIDG